MKSSSPSSGVGPITLVIPGPPRTKKNSGKFWKVGKRTVLKPSEAWLTWRDAVQRWFLQQPVAFRRPFPLPDVPHNATALIYRDANTGDAAGYYQGVADVLEDVGIVTNDMHLTQWDGSRLLVDRDNPRVEITLTPLQEP